MNDKLSQTQSRNGSNPENKTIKSTHSGVNANVTAIEESASLKASRMATLLSIEAGAREAQTPLALAIKLVNDPRSLTQFDQAFFLEKTSGAYKTLAATSQDSVNRHAPIIQMIEACAKKITLSENPDEDFGFDITKIETSWRKEQNAYPFRYLYWMPILSSETDEKSNLIGALIIARTVPWRDVDLIVLRRIINTYAHAWQALSLNHKRSTKRRYNRKLIAGVSALAFTLIMLVPVPYTTIAPAQTVAQDPWIVSAPIEGVIDQIYVNPNQEITVDQPLFSFVDTALRNGALIADNELILADARATNIKRSALIDSEGRREIAITNAERSLAKTRQTYARELLQNVEMKAPRKGIVLFTDKKDLAGRPVVIGEKIMEIADPSKVEISIEVPPGDALAMKIGQNVNVYLDVDPLKPVKGTLTRASYTPSITQSTTLAYIGTVTLDAETKTLPRIGLRGSAKLSAGKTALGFWLFRKPIVVARRTLGI